MDRQPDRSIPLIEKHVERGSYDEYEVPNDEIFDEFKRVHLFGGFIQTNRLATLLKCPAF